MKARRIDFSPDEWLQGTRRLDNATRGLYITACALIYSTGGPIDSDELRVVCRDHGNGFNRQLERLILLGKLQETDGKLMNKRCGIELENVEKRSEIASENANNRWKYNKMQDAGALLRASNATHQPSTTNHQYARSRARGNGFVNGSGAAPMAGAPEPWPQRLAAFKKSGFWMPNDWGPQPGEKGCLVPKVFLER